jgi:hypothetical protein
MAYWQYTYQWQICHVDRRNLKENASNIFFCNCVPALSKVQLEKSVITQLGNKFLIIPIQMSRTLQNAAFWDINAQVVLHRKHISFRLQSQSG